MESEAQKVGPVSSADRILFIDFEHGWIAGQTVNPISRDPFLLITSNGGRSWRRASVFEDSRAGSIQQLWFDSRNTGTLIFDRGKAGDGPRYELEGVAEIGRLLTLDSGAKWASLRG